MPKYSIIIPVCNNEVLTRACVESIEKNSDNYEVVIVDNGSVPAYAGPGRVIRNEKNLGFPVAVNQGIVRSNGDVVIILNNDTVVCPHWLEKLSAQFVNYDIVGPLTNNISGPQMLIINPPLVAEKLPEVAADIYTKNAGRSMPFSRLVFFCVAIKREVIEKVGLLDEDFSPGNYEDDDYCLRAIQAGFRLGIAEDTLIYHVGSASHKSLKIDHQKLLQRNLTIFQQKWPMEKYLAVQKQNIVNCGDLWKFPKRSLALVMVCKNEEVGLERAILSAKDFVDEIIIAVDKSSKDKTLEIAQKFATTVKQFDWCDDFAWARNFAHEGAKSDWILFLDGHEYVKKCENLEAMLDQPADGLLCTVELENGSQIRNPRIYRNGMQFTGKVHEIQNCQSLAVYPDFVVQHARVGGQSSGAIEVRNKQRDDQIERIMGQQLRDEPANTRAAFHLALFYQTKGDYKKAIKIQDKFFEFSKNAGERWYLYFNRALCHFALGRYYRTLWACDSADKETPARWEIAKMRALVFFRKKKYKQAIQFLVNSFDENLGDQTFKPWARNDADVFNLIGECYFNLALFDLAREAFEQAGKLENDFNLKNLYYDRAKVMLEL